VDRLIESALRSFSPVVATFQIVFEGAGVDGTGGCQGFFVLRRELDTDLTDDGSGDLVLQSKNVAERTFVGVGPKMAVGGNLYEARDKLIRHTVCKVVLIAVTGEILEEEILVGKHEPNTKGWQFAVASSILGWVLDAFDFFVVVFLFDALAANFHVEKKAIVWTISITLAMRPVGALLFGALADRYGRKKPLMACVLYFSTITILSGFAPNYLFFAVMRALYGIGMGGYWGIGASFAMENAPRKQRGMFPGFVYQLGVLVASPAVSFEFFLRDHFGYPWALTLFEVIVIVLLLIIFALGPEQRGRHFLRRVS
jgi:hypothetical protein